MTRQRPWRLRTHLPDLIEAKRAARAARAGGARGVGSGAAASRLAGHVLRDMPPPAGAVVSGFWPMGQEIDIRPLLQALHAMRPSDRAAGNAEAWQPTDFSVLASG